MQNGTYVSKIGFVDISKGEFNCMKKYFKKMVFLLMCTMSVMFVTACTQSDVKSVIVPEGAKSNLISGKYINSVDNNTWQFNKDGTLVISNEDGNAGEYDVRYDDTSMYLTNIDGATISFFYKDNNDGTYDITINGENADTSVLTPVEKTTENNG